MASIHKTTLSHNHEKKKPIYLQVYFFFVLLWPICEIYYIFNIKNTFKQCKKQIISLK